MTTIVLACVTTDAEPGFVVAERELVVEIRLAEVVEEGMELD